MFPLRGQYHTCETLGPGHLLLPGVPEMTRGIFDVTHGFKVINKVVPK